MSVLEKRFVGRFLPCVLIALLAASFVCLWISQQQLVRATQAYGDQVASLYADLVKTLPPDSHSEAAQKMVDDLARKSGVQAVRLQSRATGREWAAGRISLSRGSDGLHFHRDVLVQNNASPVASDVRLEFALAKPTFRDVAEATYAQILLLIVIALISTFFGISIQRQLVARPLRAFHRAINAHESGRDVAVWDEAPPPDELGKAMHAYESLSRSRLEVHRRLIVSQERLQILSDNLPNSFLYQCGLSSEGKVLFSYVGDSVRELFGVTPSQVCSDPEILRRHIDPGYLPEMAQIEEKAFRMRGEFNYECPFIFPDGSRHWVQLLSRPSQMPDGEYLWQGVFIDVTETREKDAALQQSRADARAILDALPDPVFVNPYPPRRQGAAFTHVNPSACAFLGMSESELLTLGPGDVDDLPHEEVQRILSELEKNKILRFETTFVRKDGRRFPGELCTSIIELSGQTVSISVGRSLEEQKSRETLLKEAVNQVEADRSVIAQKNIELSQLLHILCHDLANPISALNGMLGLRKNNLQCDLSDCAEISQQVLDLIGLVNRLRAIEEGKQPLVLKLVSLEEMLNQALRLVQSRLQFKTLRIISQVTPFLQVRVEPVSFLNSVLANLLTNAIKFSLSGSSIQIRAGIEGAQAILEIHDDGIGMPPDLLQRIFDPTARTTRSGTAGEIGAGFGMPLVKKFVELYGGEIHVSSTDIGDQHERPAFGHGTTVRLLLPMAGP